MASSVQYLAPITRDKCGTPAGYQKHRWEGEFYCDPCRMANRAYVNEKRKDPEVKRKRAEEAFARRQANLEEHKRKEQISRDKRKDKKNAHARAYHADNREKINKRTREYKRAHPELIKEQYQKYFEENKEKIAKYRAMNRENAKAWRDANPELFRLYNRQRRARKKAVASEPYTTEQILALYGTDCHICKEPIDLGAPRTANQKGYERGLHLDHIIPLAKGGSDLMSNVKPSHAECNLKKHTTLVL